MAQNSTTSQVNEIQRKLEFFKALLSVGTHKHLIMKVLPREEFESLKERYGNEIPDRSYDTFVKRMENALTSLRAHAPRDIARIELLDAISRALPIAQRTNGNGLVTLSLSELGDFVLDDKQFDAVLTRFGIRRTPNVNGSKAYETRNREQIHIQEQGGRQLESLQDGVRQKRMDQKHLYNDIESARHWIKLINERDYRSYRFCLEALRSMLQSATWAAHFGTAAFRNIVMLTGGGATTKDLAIAEYLTETDPSITYHYHFVDYSYFLLLDSIDSFIINMRSRSALERFKLNAYRWDVLAMDPDVHKGPFHADSGSAVFGVTAGTIGNLNEQHFYDSLNRVANKRDLLFVAADTYEDSNQKYLQVVKSFYEGPQFREWISPFLPKVHKHVNAKRGLIPDGHQVHIRPRSEGGESKIPDALSVTITLPAPYDDQVLLHSNRYKEEGFKSFAKANGWEPIDVFASPLNRNFKYFLFQRL